MDTKQVQLAANNVDRVLGLAPLSREAHATVSKDFQLLLSVVRKGMAMLEFEAKQNVTQSSAIKPAAPLVEAVKTLPATTPQSFKRKIANQKSAKAKSN